MKEIVERKLKELEKSFDYYLEKYDNENLEYQANKINELRAKISILNEVLKESEGK